MWKGRTLAGEGSERTGADLHGLGAEEIHLSPFAQASTTEFLLANGYVEKGDLSTYWCDVKKWAEQSPSDDPPGNIVVRLAEPYEMKLFMEASAVGFQDKGRTPKLLRMLAQLAIERKDMLYLCLVDGAIAGTAVMALMETSAGGVAHFYLHSTVPAYRGRGVHRALIQTRLRAAHQLGLCLATAITSVGDGSARNAERVGLELAYIPPPVYRPAAMTANETLEYHGYNMNAASGNVSRIEMS